MRSAISLIATLALATGMSAAAAQDHSHHHHHAPVAAKPAGTVRVKLPDVALTDQHGRTARFKSEFVADRLVVVNFVYTTCTTVCPVQSALFADLQQRLGERAGRDVSLLSVTVDPLRDTPVRLKEFAAQYQAGPGWSFLGGPKQAVDEVLKAFKVYTPNFADHPAVVLVGDPRTGEWTRFSGFPGSQQILARVNQLQAARPGAPQAKSH